MTAEPSDALFRRVVPGSLVSYPCSPPIEDEEARGIRLRAPSRVTFEAGIPEPDDTFARVVVCGAYHLDAGYLGLGQQLLDGIVLVAVDSATHRAYAGTLAAASPAPSPDPLAHLPPERLAGRSIVGYFNPNLASILDLPAAEADYVVYAALGAFVSNAVRVEVRRAG